MQEIRIYMKTNNIEIYIKLDRIKDRFVILANLVDSIKLSNVTDVTGDTNESEGTELID